MYMIDAEEQEKIEEQREQEPPIKAIEIDENSSLEDRMKAKLSEVLHKDPENEEDNEQLLVLLRILEDDENPDDDIFKGKHGNYSIGDGYVGGDVFKEGTANDSIENIQGVLELATVAKASLGDNKVFLNGAGDAEQMAMHAYAAELAGLNVENADSSELSPEIKQKMDQAWSAMNNENSLELDNNLNQNPTMQAENQQRLGTLSM